ncbi:hypothetical protein [Phormidium sp. CCY1219]|jgi:hypothetical protein|uniref:hypothetical protein n=1 Tax=Phormidium sp. CCY1219 TaxID=2886104 RepID=UPI002D1E4CCE|nr:hypothetical protein [Phormidium sp. CCY1219]MEB3827328.1 hypothetical protein [Phormidium sp. CCY1219]
MLVILMEDKIIAPRQVCQSCLLADSTGEPRWRQGKLCCGHALGKLADQQATQFECQMGFRIANID